MGVEELTDSLRTALGARAADMDEAILSYAAEIMDGEDDIDEVYEGVAPLLVDSGGADDEAAARAVIDAVLASARAAAGGGESGGAGGGGADAGFEKLSAPVIVSNMMDTHAAERLSRLCLTTFAPARVNALISVWEDGAGEMDEETYAARKKLEKKVEKKEKRFIKAERGHAAERDDMLKALTRAPVVIHNSEQVGLAGPSDIHLKNITIDLGGMVLVDDTDLTLVFGRRYGLTGKNGSGKTTFMKHLAAHAFEGMPKMQILHIEQEVNGTDISVLQTVLQTDVEREDLLNEVRAIEAADAAAAAAASASASAAASTGDSAAAAAAAPAEPLAPRDIGARLTEIYTRLEEIDADGAVSRAASILSGLGFDPEMQERPTQEFSGGWRMRVSLAMALFIKPMVLLLDEPTNHLDLPAVVWLEDYLNTWENTLIVVSHARDFLDAVCTDIVHLSDKKLTRWKGDYSTFEERFNESIRQQEKAHAAQEKERAHMKSFIDKFRANANRAAMVQSRIKALEKMSLVDTIAIDPDIVFHFPNPGPFQGNIAQLSEVSFSYKPNPTDADMLFRGANLSIDNDSRVCLVGPNGAGKSTIAKLLFGDITASRGEVRINGKARMARFSQHHVDQLDLKKSAVEFFRAEFPDEPVQKIRAHLGKMGAGGNMALQPMFTLSGGQKSRVSFAYITYNPPHFLLLDEPTNHLDLNSVQALIEAISVYEGAICVITHDRYLIEACCDRLIVLEDRKLTEWKGDFMSYKKHLSAQIRAQQAAKK
jgi:ATP-binding cassette subfamily F protein 3